MEVSESGKKKRKQREKVMNRKIKVLMCGSDIGAFKGGMVTVVRNYLECGEFHRSRLIFIPTHISGSKVRRIVCYAKAYIKVALLLLGRRIDIAHLHMSERGSFYRKAWLLKLLHTFRVPVILHHHGAEFEDFYQKLPPRGRRYVCRVLESAECNLVLSELLKEKMLKKAPDAVVQVLSNAVEVPEKRNYHPAPAKIIMLGRQGKRKGSYDLLKALSEIRDRLPEETEIWMCGDGAVETVKMKAKELGLEKQVVCTGWISGKEKEACLKDATIHVLPSYREALPMSILETMSCGIPNISTRIASIPEVIEDGKNGFLINPGDITALGKTILCLLKDAELRERMSRNSYRKMQEDFSLQACVSRLEEIYADCLQRAGK